MHLFKVTANRTICCAKGKKIEKGTSISISSDCSPSSKTIQEAFERQGIIAKGSLSTDFFTIKRE